MIGQVKIVATVQVKFAKVLPSGPFTDVVAPFVNVTARANPVLKRLRRRP